MCLVSRTKFDKKVQLTFSLTSPPPNQDFSGPNLGLESKVGSQVPREQKEVDRKGPGKLVNGLTKPSAIESLFLLRNF